MASNRAGRTQEFVAIDGGLPVADEVDRLSEQVARLEQELEAERARSAGLYAQLTVVSRQLDDAQSGSGRGRRLGRNRR